MKELPAILTALEQPAAYPAVLATLVRVEGSSYRRPGARLLITADGTRVGSISGGCLEDDLVARADNIRRTERAEVVIYDTTSENDLVWGVGLGCHGVVHVLLEPLPRPPVWLDAVRSDFDRRRPCPLAVTYGGPSRDRLGTRLEGPDDPFEAPAEHVFRDPIPPRLALLIFGAGNDAQPLVRMAKEFGWHVTVVDPRPAFATSHRFPLADAWVTGPLSETLARITTDDRTAAVIMTHHYVHDLPILGSLIHRPLAYLGLLGPRKRAERLVRDLTAQGTPPPAETWTRLRAPVGLDLGGDTPESVALAILAEIQATLSGRDGRPLRERDRPIHP